MPMQETSLPIDATALKITANGQDYSILLDTDTFDRAGEDGDVPILPLCRGDEFVGEVLEGQWKKDWDANIDAFTARILSGALEMTGVASVAGTWGSGWISGQHPIPLMDGTEITFEMETPISDTGAVADRDVYYNFYLTPKTSTSPNGEPNFLMLRIDISEVGLIYSLLDRVATAFTTHFDGSTYDGASVRDPAAERFTIWRFVFHDGVDGVASPSNVRHMHVYLKQGIDRATAEAATENELGNGTQDSPYDISGWLVDVVYPNYLILSQNTTYFGTAIGSANGVDSTYLRVNHPPFSLKYDFADADVGKGDVELWDGDPDVATSIQVFDEDHIFTNDPYLQNDLLRLHVNEGIVTGLDLYFWDTTGVAWSLPFNELYFTQAGIQTMQFPFLKRIISISPEKIGIEVKLCDDGTDDEDYFVNLTITLRRGMHHITVEPTALFPPDDCRVWFINTPTYRFGYAGDDEVGDDDLTIDGYNTTLTDNFLVGFDDTLTEVLAFMANTKKPTSGNARFNASDGGDLGLEDLTLGELLASKIIFGLTPFSLVANLFEEAEDGSRGTATLVTDAAASPPAGPNNAVQLNAIGDYQVPNGEYSAYTFTAGTDLPVGRYLAVIRARYVVQEGMRMYVWQDFDNEYRNEENAKASKAITATFDYYSVVFDITASDVANTRAFAVVAEKVDADADEIRIDYHLIVPIGDGESWPQDFAHAYLRNFNKPKRVFTR